MSWLMLVKAFSTSLRLLLLAAAAAILLGWFIPSRLGETELLAAAAALSKSNALRISGILLLLAILFAVPPAWRMLELWQGRGLESLCHVCGGLTTLKPRGKYGPYRHCLNCGKNSRAC